MKADRSSSEFALLLRLIDEAYDRKAWHGPTLKGSIRAMPARKAGFRPAPGRKCIAEIVLHAAYWKYAVRRRMRGDKRGSFPLPGSNWFATPDPLPDKTWRDYVKLLETQHRLLRATVADLPRLAAESPQSARRFAELVRGIAMHDIYHTGQIRTLRAMQAK